MELVRETGSHFDLDEEAARRLMGEVLTRPLFAHRATTSEHAVIIVWLVQDVTQVRDKPVNPSLQSAER